MDQRPPLAASTPSGRSLASGPAILALLLAAEIAIFSVLGTGFFSLANAFEISRLCVEVGLLALALTPVIVTGGIDLSVGSLLGLSAVLLGKLWRDADLPLGLAALLTLVSAAACGGLNAVLITRLRIPPLIVTLGSYSLFRGLAEGLTGAVDNFTGFPPEFLRLGQGYLGQGALLGSIPAQLPIFVLAIVSFWLLLHRSTIGRALSAIGFSPEGARHAGIPVERWVGLTYVLSGLSAGLAAIIYVAHLGQAKADAGTSYELAAITAVVLGGTSIFGGSGTIAGSVLGLLAIVVLQVGLRLADLPAELAGGLTGGLLLLAIGLSRWHKEKSGAASEPALSPAPHPSGVIVKNAQVAVLCGVILAAALIVAGSNWYLAQSLRPQQAGGSPEARPVTVALMPKSKGNAYFEVCRKGAEEAARELNVKLLWDGPTDPDPARQNEIIDTWITRGVDVIAVAAENREGVSSVLRKARGRGIKVITWDSDALPDARDFFVNQATPEGIGQTLMDNAARVLGGKGEVALITASLTAANMIEWQKAIEAYRKEKYPDITILKPRPCDDRQDKAFDEARDILNAHPEVKLIMAICSPAVPGAAEAVKQSGRKDVKVVGLGLPGDSKTYVHAGIVDCVILWNIHDLGYLTVFAAHALKTGTLSPGDRQLRAGPLGALQIQGDNILLGKPVAFTRENIDSTDF